MSIPDLLPGRATRPLPAGVMALFGVLLLAGLAWAAGDLIWEDVFDFAANDDSASDVARGGREVIAVGRAENALGQTGFHVRATDARDGSFLWDDHFEFPGGSVRAFEIAIHGARAFVVGEGDDAAGDHFLVVRAYHRTTGALLWADNSMVGGRLIHLPAVATDGLRVFVSSARTQPSGDRDMLVRAYDAGTGGLVWEEQYDRGGDDFTADVAVHGGRVFLSGGAATAPFPVHTDFTVRALDAMTGLVLWENFFDFDGHLDQARGIAVSGGRVYAAGFGRHPGADDDIVVRAYDAATGAALWTDTFDRAGNSDFAPSIAALGSRVFVAGWAADAAGNTDFLVRAHDAQTGTLLWQDLSDGPGDFDFALDLEGRDDRLYVVGQMGSSGGGLDAVVRAYDAPTGALAWEDRFGTPGKDDLATGVTPAKGSLVTTGNRALYVSGIIRDPSSPDSDWTVRAYGLADDSADND